VIKNAMRNIYLLSLLGLLLSGCIGMTESIRPLTDNDHQYASSDQELQLIARAEAAHEELLSKGLMYRDQLVSDYIKLVGNSVTPPMTDGAAKINFYVLKDPSVNAMAFPNGNVYINIGLLARLENEAQLAHVLSHEVAHVVHRHSLKTSYSRQNTIVAAHITDLLMFGTSLAYLPYISQLAAYSQDQELESDQFAMEYMYRANYDVRQAQEVFRVIQETKVTESVPGSIYASHPTHQQRVAQARQWIAASYSQAPADAMIAAESYQSISEKITHLNLKLKLNDKQYQLTIEAADNALQKTMSDPWLWYYKGEAYRLMAEHPKSAAREYSWLHGKEAGDAGTLLQRFTDKKSEHLEKAQQVFREGLSRAGELPQFHRGIGLVAYAKGDAQSAVNELQTYLDRAPTTKDKLYIEHLLQEIGEGQNAH